MSSRKKKRPRGASKKLDSATRIQVILDQSMIEALDSKVKQARSIGIKSNRSEILRCLVGLYFN